MEKKITSRQIARWMWNSDGRPDGYQLGEANKRTYEREAVAVMRAIRALGYRVVPKR